MRVGRHYLGKYVEVVWMDPNYDRVDADKILKGRAALATWKERGVIYDITDGIVLVAHSEAVNSGSTALDEIARTAIHEALIERITVYVPEAPAPPEPTL